MKQKTIALILTVFVVGLLAAAYVYFFVINKKHPDYEKLTPDYTLEASALFEAYRTDNASATAQYNGKIVAVHGELTGVDESGDIIVAVMAIEEGLFGDEGLRIRMLPKHAEILKTFNPGSKITLKGYVTGYNETDVVLEHGSIIND